VLLPLSFSYLGPSSPDDNGLFLKPFDPEENGDTDAIASPNDNLAPIHVLSPDLHAWLLYSCFDVAIHDDRV